jgi:hypothetical protein
MTPSLSTRLTRFVTNKYTRFFVGASLVLSGLDDVFDEINRGEYWELGVHHGVVVFGFYKLLGAVADILHGFETAVEPD